MRELPPPSLYDLDHRTIADATDPATADAAYHHLYVHRRPPGDHQLLREVADATKVGPAPPLRRLTRTTGRTATKDLFGLADGGAIESVTIRRRTGTTACVSSQAGCAFGCTFCASGRLGLARHLRTGEIVQQVLALGPRINRVVFMGMGEPLHNYARVLAGIRILRDRRGLALRTSGITISTIGVPRRLAQLREEHLAINLTISLHATTDEVRRELIPGARGTPVADVVAASQRWARRHNRRVTYVYLLLPGVNATRADADRLVDLLAGPLARVNLMRWNPVLGGDTYRRIDDAGLVRFKTRLERGGLDVVVRDTQGADIEAACGQLVLRRGGGGR